MGKHQLVMQGNGADLILEPNQISLRGFYACTSSSLLPN